MDWDETDDHDFSDSEVDYYMGKEPRKTGGSKQHIHQQPQPKKRSRRYVWQEDGVYECSICSYVGSLRECECHVCS